MVEILPGNFAEAVLKTEENLSKCDWETHKRSVVVKRIVEKLVKQF